jgi:hypothetical protein
LSLCKGRSVVWIEFMATIASAVHNDLDVHDEPPTASTTQTNARAQLAFRGECYM